MTKQLTKRKERTLVDESSVTKKSERVTQVE